jgi:hypothetical protein
MTREPIPSKPVDSGRVADAMSDVVDAAVEAFDDVYDGVSHNKREAIQHAITAALAAQGQGEAVGSVYTMEALVPGGEVKCHATLNRTLPIGTKLYTHPASPAGVPDQVRYALDRCLRSQEQMAERIEKANPGDPYIAVMIHEDIEIIRQHLAAPSTPKGDRGRKPQATDFTDS